MPSCTILHFPMHSVFKFFIFILYIKANGHALQPYKITGIIHILVYMYHSFTKFQILQIPCTSIQTSLLLSITLGIILGKLWPKMYTKRSSEIPSFNISSIRCPSCCRDIFTKQRARTSCWKASGIGLKEYKF
jgi:hypothetical protein